MLQKTLFLKNNTIFVCFRLLFLVNIMQICQTKWFNKNKNKYVIYRFWWVRAEKYLVSHLPSDK